ncbi:hypothetical protein HanXRQr2_Chr11g0514941 [Helianthus annuus]|uniref:Uncharacterized protein n=1 Tax=Helianthus annuus TaxID=4232 RepID=A0A9K3N214_HELAN|nr:hypothetical protein HanXRQr2_Chr11g0514941 [Helianthus annuus]
MMIMLLLTRTDAHFDIILHRTQICEFMSPFSLNCFRIYNSRG